jgi:hypothetical protein
VASVILSYRLLIGWLPLAASDHCPGSSLPSSSAAGKEKKNKKMIDERIRISRKWGKKKKSLS